jgi:transposase
LTVIYRQEILQDIRLFTNQPKAKFYSTLFLHLNVEPFIKSSAKTGRKSQRAALFCAFIVMKCEGFSQITDLVDYLTNNLLIAYYCGFDITQSLPEYSTFSRFIRNLDNQILKDVMQSQVLKLSELGLIDTSFIGLDSTPIMANTYLNNPKAFMSNAPSQQPKSDKDCRVGVRTASNQHNDRNYEFYHGYKNHVLSDCITGLPIYELTTPANIYDSTVTLDILAKTHSFLPVTECSFLGDAAYDVKEIYNTIKDYYQGDCYIPINPRNTKDVKKLPSGVPVCDAGLPMHRNGFCRADNRPRQQFCCPFKRLSRKQDCPIGHPNFRKEENTGCTKSITIPDDYRLSIDRKSIEFKSVFALRTECERYNSRFKSTGQARLWVRNGNSAANLNSIAHISLLAIAVASVITGSSVSYRCLKSVKRVA